MVPNSLSTVPCDSSTLIVHKHHSRRNIRFAEKDKRGRQLSRLFVAGLDVAGKMEKFGIIVSFLALHNWAKSQSNTIRRFCGNIELLARNGLLCRANGKENHIGMFMVGHRLFIRMGGLYIGKGKTRTFLQ